MISLVLALLLCCPYLQTLAQKSDSIYSLQSRYYVGIGTNNINYHIYYKNPTTTGPVRSGYFVPFFLNFGYALSKRASIQIGLGYGGDKDESNWSRVEQINGVFIDKKAESRTKVVAFSATMKHNIFKVYKRIPIYATLTIMPVFGTTTLNYFERENNTAINTASHKDTGINVFATAGFGLNYKIWKRLSGFTEVLLVKSNLNGNNSIYYDWNLEFSQRHKYLAFTTSLGLGVNYTL